jgi:hypothetical protein
VGQRPEAELAYRDVALDPAQPVEARRAALAFLVKHGEPEAARSALGAAARDLDVAALDATLRAREESAARVDRLRPRIEALVH